jgi:hypothetical protein
MKRQTQRATGLTGAGCAWLCSMAGLPAALISMPARQSQQDWLGWDGWVTVSPEDPGLE